MANIGDLIASLGIDTKDLAKDLNKGKRIVKSASKTMGNSFKMLQRQVFSLKGALVGLGLGLVAKSFLDAASTSEQFNVRLKVLLGSAEEGNRLFKDMAIFAGQVPFEYEKIMSASTQLSGVMQGGVDEIKEWMPLIGDLAAASGLGIEKTTEQVIRMYSAGAASADLFRERGILAMLGFQAGVQVSAEETRKRLMEAWEDPASKFRGATDELAKTWTGAMSMLSDAWFLFRNEVMDTGAFDGLKKGIGLLLDKIQELKESGDFQKWAQGLGLAFAEAVATTIELLGKIPVAIQEVTAAINKALAGIKAVGVGLADTAAVSKLMLSPSDKLKMGKLILEGKSFGETLAILNPELAQMKENLMKSGAANHQAAIEAEQHAQNLQKIADSAQEVADAIRLRLGKDVVSTDLVSEFQKGMKTGEDTKLSPQAQKEFDKLQLLRMTDWEKEQKWYEDRLKLFVGNQKAMELLELEHSNRQSALLQKEIDEYLAWEEERQTKLTEEHEQEIERKKELAEFSKQLLDDELAYRHQAYEAGWTGLMNLANSLGGEMSEGVGAMLLGLKGVADVAEGEDPYSQQIAQLEDFINRKVDLYKQGEISIDQLNEYRNKKELQRDKLMSQRKLHMAKSMFGGLAGIAQTFYELSDRQSKAAFIAYKAFAIGETIIDTYRAAQGAYAALAGIPVVGPALGVAAAAAAIVAGMARVRAITSQQPGGATTSAPSGGGGYNYSRPAQPRWEAPEGAVSEGGEGRQRVVTVHIHGNIVDHAAFVRELSEYIEEAKGDKVNFG